MSRLVYGYFGSKNGLLRFVGHGILATFGAYRRYPAEKPDENQRLVFICSGNICRSPLAEVYARSLGKEASSCGLNCTDGHPADPRARQFAAANGLDLDNHLTVNVTNFEFSENDFIILMEPAHIDDFHRKVGPSHRMALAGAYCSPPNPYIHDPYSCSDEFFSRCERKVMEAVGKLCE
ncbi:low molecular weight phosphatase family protein [Marinobacter suaedae]|uniref:arsenate-mycothiol transferase ArsC n=1 Tax=Marinobacter suaedae TaxID=3057675 RepID=UPI003B968844